MAKLHKNLTGDDLHAPKGMSLETSSIYLYVSQSSGVATSSISLVASTPSSNLGSAKNPWGELFVTTGSVNFVDPVTNTVVASISVDESGNIDLGGSNYISSSAQVQLDGITGTTFANADFTFPQNLIVNGNLTAQQFFTEVVSASIIFESGSTIFGNSSDDTHQFTGSVSVNGPIFASSLTGSLLATNGIVSSSAQIATDISGSFGQASSSFSTRVTSLEAFSSSLDATYATDAQLSAVSSSLASNIANNLSSIGNLQTDSGSFSTRVTSLEAFSSSLDATYATDSELSAASASLASSIVSLDNEITDLQMASGSFSSRVTSLEAFSSSLDATYATDNQLSTVSSSLAQSITSNLGLINDLQTDSGSFSSRVSSLESFSSSLDATYATDSELNASSSALISGYTTADTTLSSSLSTDIASNLSLISDLQTDSGSFSTRVTTNESNIASLQTDSGSFSTRVSSNESNISNLQTDSGSFSTRVSSLENFSSSLDSTFTTDSELNASSSALISGYTTADTNLSSSLSADIASNLSSISDLQTDSGSFSIRVSTNETDIAALQTDSGSFSNRITSVETFSASLNEIYTTDAELNASSSALISGYTTADTNLSSSLAADIATLSNKTLVSGSVQIDHDQTTNFVANEHINHSSVNLTAGNGLIGGGDITTSRTFSVGQGDGIVTSSNAIAVDSTVVRTSGDQTISGNKTFSGDNLFSGLQTFNNINVNGTASFALITSVTGSAKIIGDAYILLNNNTPSERYAGIKVIDSGSAGVTASLEFDGSSNDWFYEYSDDGGATTDHGVIIFGPEYATKGSPTYPTNNKLQKGTGDHHLADSSITDDGSSVTIGVNTVVDGTLRATGTTIVSGSAQISHDNTTGFVADEHVAHSGVTITAGSGLTGGGTIEASRTINVGAGDGITVSADAVAVDGTVLRTTGDGIVSSSAQINHDNTTGFVSNEHIDHSTVTFTAGTGLSGGGTIAASRTFDLDLNELSTSTDNTDGDYFVVVDSADGSQHKLTKANINISGFNNDANYSTTTGTVTSVTVSGSNGLTGNTTVTSAGSINLQHADTSAQGSVNNSGRTFIQDITLDGFGHVTGITSATDSDTYVGTVTSVATGTGLTGGTITSTGTISLSHLGFQTLTDPNADRIAFWDDSAGSFAWLSAGTNITISGTTISATDTNTTYSAGNGISLAGTTFSVAAGGGLTQDASGLSHSDTSALSGNYGGAGNGIVIEDITVDGYGHVTAIDTVDLDSRFLGISATAAAASQWATARTITLGGDLSGNVSIDGSANVTLSATVSDDSHNHSISTISDEHRLFNNMGDNHGTRTDFNATYDFGWRYVQGTTNGPGVNSATQYYSVYAGLGNDYAYNTYGMQIAYPRNVSSPYPTIRYRENGSWGSWNKISAGYADSAGNADTVDSLHASSFVQTTGTQTVGGSKTFSDAIYFNGAVTIGNSFGDTFNVTAATMNCNQSNAGNPFTIYNANGGSNLELSTASGLVKVNDDFQATGEITAYASDDRLKNRISLLENPIDRIKQLDGFTYTWNETAKEIGIEGDDVKVGVSAQQVQAVLPEAVRQSPVNEEYLTVQYEKLVPLLIEGMKEQQKQIEVLTAKIEELESKIS